MADGHAPLTEDDDDGPFGKPLIDDPSAREARIERHPPLAAIV